MDDIRVEKWTLDDGRRAEKRIKETVTGAGESERIVEIHVEDERPLRLSERVVEKTKPFVYERKVESVDKEGNVVDQKVEAIEPRVQMKLVEHISTVDELRAKSVESYDNHVTKQEMIDTIVAAVKASQESSRQFQGNLKTLGLAEEVAERVEQVKSYSLTDKILLGVIVAQVVGLGYIIFGM